MIIKSQLLSNFTPNFPQTTWKLELQVFAIWIGGLRNVWLGSENATVADTLKWEGTTNVTGIDKDTQIQSLNAVANTKKVHAPFLPCIWLAIICDFCSSRSTHNDEASN